MGTTKKDLTRTVKKEINKILKPTERQGMQDYEPKDNRTQCDRCSHIGCRIPASKKDKFGMLTCGNHEEDKPMQLMRNIRNHMD